MAEQALYLRCSEIGSGLFATQQQIEQVVVAQIHQRVHRRCIGFGHATAVLFEVAGDDEVVLQKPTAAAPAQLAEGLGREEGKGWHGLCQRGQMARFLANKSRRALKSG